MSEYIEMQIAGIKVRIETENSTEDIFGVIDAFVEPMLQALGFQQKAINNVLKKNDYE